MHYLKRLVSGFSLGVLFTIETAFYATPPANAQPAPDNDCAIYAVAFAADMTRNQVLDVTNVMEGPAHSEETITDMLRATGRGQINPRRFASRRELDEFLLSNGDSEYVVGYQRINSPIGHVLNARVINRQITFIDRQSEARCETPTNAEPPIDPPGFAPGPYTYYAWLTRTYSSMDSLTFLFGNMTLLARDVNDGNFTSSCQNITLFTNFDRNNSVSLSGECRNALGTFTPTAINLNGYIINSFGGLVWQNNGGFGGSVRNCELKVENVTVLQCEAGDGNGSWKKVAISLDTHIVNDNGKLAVRL